MINKLLYIVLVLLVLSLAGWKLANSEWAFSTAISQINKLLEEDNLSIDYQGFSGNLLSDFTIEEVVLRTATNELSDSLISIHTLSVVTNPFLLFRSQTTFNTLRIETVKAHIAQDSSNALWRYITKERDTDSSIPSFKLNKIALNRGDVSFQSADFSWNLTQFSFDIGASYSPELGVELALPYADGSLTYYANLADTNTFGWDFHINTGNSFNPYGQLLIQSTEDSQTTIEAIPVPQLIQAKLAQDTNKNNPPRFLASAIFSKESQLSMDFPLRFDAEKQQVQLLEKAKVRWVKPIESFQLPDSLGIPKIDGIDLENTSSITFGLNGLITDTIGYRLRIEGIDGTSLGVKNLHLSSTGNYNFAKHTSEHTLAIVSAGLPNTPLEITAQTSFKDPIIYGKIQSSSTKNLALNNLLNEPLDVDFSLQGWEWTQDLNYNTTDNFFEGSLKIQLPKSTLNTIQFSSFLVNGRYSAIGANMDLLAKSEAGNFGVQLFGVHFEDAVEHEVKVDFQDLDLGKWLNKSGFNTTLNATGSIIGSGKNPFETESAIDFYFKESYIQSAKIDTARLTASLNRGVLKVEQLTLKSDLAEGLFNAGINLNEIFSPKNTLEGYLSLKNPTSLAPLFGLDTLNATGMLTLKISPDLSGNINLFGSFDIDNFRFGYNQEIGKIDGVIRIPMQAEPTLVGSINAYNATISNAKLSNMSNQITAKLGANSISGTSQSRFQNGEDYSANIVTNFNYNSVIKATSIWLDTLSIRHKNDQLELTKASSIELTTNEIFVDTVSLINIETGSAIAFNYEQSGSTINGFFKANTFDLYKAQQCFLVEQPFKGAISTNISWHGTKENLSLSGPFYLQDLGFNDIQIPSLQGTLSLNNALLDFQSAIYASASNDSIKLAQLNLKTNIARFDSIALEVTFPQNSFANWQPIHPSIKNSFKGNIRANASINGAVLHPEVNGLIQLNSLSDGSNIFADSLIVKFSQDATNKPFKLNGSAYLVAEKAFELIMQTPVMGYNSRIMENNGEMFMPFSADSSVSFELTANDFNLKFLNNISPLNKQIRIGKGFLNTRLYASGPIKDLFPKGNLTIDQFDVSWLQFGLTHQSSYVSMSLDRDKITIDNALFRGDQGSVNAKGTWILPTADFSSSPIDLSIKFENFLSLNNAVGRFRTNGSLQFSGNSATPKLNGTLQLNRGKLVIDALENKEIEEVKLNDEDTVSYFDFNTWLYGLESAIEVEIAEDISVRNNTYPRIELYPVGKLNIVKAKNQEDWQVFGGLSANRGSIDLLGKRFQLQDSRVDFDGNPMNPQLSIEAMYRIPKPHEVSIWYLVEGRLNEPSFTYRSNPEMELQNMISYILFNKPFYALESWEQSLAATDQNAGGSASNIAIQLLANRIEQLAAQRLGIDLVQIDNTRTGSRNATTLKTGWYLNNKTFFAIMNELGVTNPQTQFILEYLIGRDLNLILTQTNDDGTRLDVRWRYDY